MYTVHVCVNSGIFSTGTMLNIYFFNPFFIAGVCVGDFAYVCVQSFVFNEKLLI